MNDDNFLSGALLVIGVVFVLLVIANFVSMPSNSEMRRGAEQRQQMQHYSGDYSYAVE